MTNIVRWWFFSAIFMLFKCLIHVCFCCFGKKPRTCSLLFQILLWCAEKSTKYKNIFVFLFYVKWKETRCRKTKHNSNIFLVYSCQTLISVQRFRVKILEEAMFVYNKQSHQHNTIFCSFISAQLCMKLRSLFKFYILQK